MVGDALAAAPVGVGHALAPAGAIELRLDPARVAEHQAVDGLVLAAAAADAVLRRLPLFDLGGVALGLFLGDLLVDRLLFLDLREELFGGGGHDFVPLTSCSSS